MADTAVLLEIITYIFQRTPPTADCDEPLSYRRVRGHQVTFVRKYPDPEVIKYLSCLTQLSLKIFLLINVRMPTSYLSLKKKTKLLIFLYL